MHFLNQFTIVALCVALPSYESWRFNAPVDTLEIRTPGTWSAASTGHEGKISSGWLAELGDADLT